MIYGLFVIFACQALGEMIKLATGTILPGAVIGMLLLFALLLARRGVPAALGAAGMPLIGALPLLLTPPSVGLFFIADQLQGKVFAVVLVIVIGTITTLVVSALLMSWLIRITGKSLAP